jgi:hypothetical protein
LTIEFGQSGVRALVRVISREQYFVFEAADTSIAAADELTFLRFQLKPQKQVCSFGVMVTDDVFACALYPLTPQVRMSSSQLEATVCGGSGIAGGKVALIACPADGFRDVLKKVFLNEGLSYSPLGGPFAADAKMVRCSYLFASDVTNANVDKWIALAQKSGIGIIHLSGWETAQGHYEPRKDLYPGGLADLKAVVNRIHKAGLKASTHNLTGCIQPHDPFVTPVPDKRLAKDRLFTLAADIGEREDAVPVAENPKGLDTIWAYASHGNVVQVDDELIQYVGLSETSPYALTKCIRGAFGTRVSSHRKGASVQHLYCVYESFYPDKNSTLLDEVAQCVAGFINECGFDMAYMDGSEGMPDNGAGKMLECIYAKLKRPVRMEGAVHSWVFASSPGTWDLPYWGLKRFVDLHCQNNVECRRATLLPTKLGWWALFGPSNDVYAQMPDEVEYLCCKALGYDSSLSFQGLTPGDNPQNARQDEYLGIISRYEKLRLSGYFSQSVLERLRKPKEEFHLVQAPDGEWQFLPTDYAGHTVNGLVGDNTSQWAAKNRFSAQPVRFRLQALYAAGSYNGPDTLTLTDFADVKGWAAGAAPGVAYSLVPTTERVKAGAASGCYTAKNSKPERGETWTKVSKVFSPPVNIEKYGAMGVWIYGDGKGEILNFQLTNLPQYWDTMAEHYVTVDFTGWRYFELLFQERDAERNGEYLWPYNGQGIVAYKDAVYRSPLVKKAIDSLNIFYNNLPPNDNVKCYISPVKALSAVKKRFANPRLTINGSHIVLPVSLESGQYIECLSSTSCVLYDENGTKIKDLTIGGEVPLLRAGDNSVAFTCDAPEGCARAKITLISSGEPLKGVALGKEGLKAQFRKLDKQVLDLSDGN